MSQDKDKYPPPKKNLQKKKKKRKKKTMKKQDTVNFPTETHLN